MQRVTVDNQGEHTGFSGGPVGGGMVFSGAEAGPGGQHFDVILRITPVGRDVELTFTAGVGDRSPFVLVYRRQ